MAVGLQEFLKYEGYDIQIAQSGAEALPFLEVKSLRPDVVLLDLWIPGINGFELLGKFLGPPSGPEIPVIALSGDPIALEVARHRGIVASFSKPVHLDALLDTIQIFCPSSSRQAPRSKVV